MLINKFPCGTNVLTCRVSVHTSLLCCFLELFFGRALQNQSPPHICKERYSIGHVMKPKPKLSLNQASQRIRTIQRGNQLQLKVRFYFWLDEKVAWSSSEVMQNQYDRWTWPPFHFFTLGKKPVFENSLYTNLYNLILQSSLATSSTLWLKDLKKILKRFKKLIVKRLRTFAYKCAI